MQKGKEVTMHEPSQTGRRDGWKDRLKRSAGAKFKLMMIEEDMFLCIALCVWFSMMSGSSMVTTKNKPLFEYCAKECGVLNILPIGMHL